MKINRLTEIILILLNKKSVTAKELASKFQVSTRTIYRDIETLSLSGVPVYMNQGKGGGIYLLEDFSINKTLLSKSDKESLILALNALSSIEYPDIKSVIDKVGLVKDVSREDSWIEIDLSRWGSKSSDEDKFIEIKYAILNKKLIEFSYTNSYASSSNRTIEPIKLVYKGQSWYLFGYCKLKEDFRLFRISRIKKLNVKEENFTVRDYKINELSKRQCESFKLVKIKLRIKKEALYRAFDDFVKEAIIENNDGTYDVCVEFPESEWLYGYIMSFGANAQVIEPIYIRNIVMQRLQESIDIYKKEN